jgi:hypothetical protein
MLQIVKMQVLVDISFEGVPEERVVSLPSVENFTLIMSDVDPVTRWRPTYIVLPRESHRSCTRQGSTCSWKKYFPPSVSWNAIVRQYTTSPPEEATLEMWPDYTPLHM